MAVTLALAGLAGIAGALWLRDQRRWRLFHAASGQRPDSAVRLHQELRRANLRTRYRAGPGGFASLYTNSRANHTAEVLVHRDDLPRAQAIRATMRQSGRL